MPLLKDLSLGIKISIQWKTENLGSHEGIFNLSFWY